jgi:hypothetical protein
MKKFAFIAGWISIILINLWWRYNSFEYFSKNLTDLIYVFAPALACGLACGIVLYIFEKFSLENQLKIRIILWGSIAMLLSGFCIWLLFMSIQIFRLEPPVFRLIDSPASIILEASNVIMILITSGIWLYFNQLRNNRK